MLLSEARRSSAVGVAISRPHMQLQGGLPLLTVGVMAAFRCGGSHSLHLQHVTCFWRSSAVGVYSHSLHLQHVSRCELRSVSEICSRPCRACAFSAFFGSDRKRLPCAALMATPAVRRLLEAWCAMPTEKLLQIILHALPDWKVFKMCRAEGDEVLTNAEVLGRDAWVRQSYRDVIAYISVGPFNHIYFDTLRQSYRDVIAFEEEQLAERNKPFTEENIQLLRRGLSWVELKSLQRDAVQIDGQAWCEYTSSFQLLGMMVVMTTEFWVGLGAGTGELTLRESVVGGRWSQHGWELTTFTTDNDELQKFAKTAVKLGVLGPRIAMEPNSTEAQTFLRAVLALPVNTPLIIWEME